jgi:GNAT superfamily N-acetyltransferase
MNIAAVTTDNEISACFAVMAELRPHLHSSTFVSLIRDMQREGYRMAYLSVADRVISVAGYRTKRTLFCNRFLYVDDLVTAGAERSRGYGKALLAWLMNEAVALGCEQLHLDSGLQRVDAHRFYKANAMEASGYHFRINLRPSP